MKRLQKKKLAVAAVALAFLGGVGAIANAQGEAPQEEAKLCGRVDNLL